MRHRIVSITGIGNPDPVLLDNTGEINKNFADAAIEAYFSNWEGFDFSVKEDRVDVGIEPTYQYNPLLIVSINKDKMKSFIKRGKAWGSYGSDIVTSIRVYRDYKYKSKFVKFVDKWHSVLFKELR